MMDDWTKQHLAAWADRELWHAERDSIVAGIVALVEEHPDLIESPDGRSWPELRAMVERNDTFGIGVKARLAGRVSA